MLPLSYVDNFVISLFVPLDLLEPGSRARGPLNMRKLQVMRRKLQPEPSRIFHYQRRRMAEDPITIVQRLPSETAL